MFVNPSQEYYVQQLLGTFFSLCGCVIYLIYCSFVYSILGRKENFLNVRNEKWLHFRTRREFRDCVVLHCSIGQPLANWLNGCPIFVAFPMHLQLFPFIHICSRIHLDIDLGTWLGKALREFRNNRLCKIKWNNSKALLLNPHPPVILFLLVSYSLCPYCKTGYIICGCGFFSCSHFRWWRMLRWKLSKEWRFVKLTNSDHSFSAMSFLQLI